MRLRRASLSTAAALLLLLGGLLFASCGGDDEGSGETTTTVTTTTETTPPPAQPTIVRIVAEGGVPQGGIARWTVAKGDKVVLVVTSDVADEVHVHGYDISRGVPAGGTARITFVAKLPGRFEVELEERGAQIADLTVEP